MTLASIQAHATANVLRATYLDARPGRDARPPSRVGISIIRANVGVKELEQHFARPGSGSVRSCGDGLQPIQKDREWEGPRLFGLLAVPRRARGGCVAASYSVELMVPSGALSNGGATKALPLSVFIRCLSELVGGLPSGSFGGSARTSVDCVLPGDGDSEGISALTASPSECILPLRAPKQERRTQRPPVRTLNERRG